MGGTVFMLASSAFLVLETILQLCVIGAHSLTGQETIFIALLVIIVAPIIIINIISAINVIRTNDFSGKNCGRIICIAFHSVQLGILWRSFKLFVAFDLVDWTTFVNMRLFQSGFQSVPFSILLCYQTIVSGSSSALSIITMVFSLISASIAFATHRAESVIYPQDDDSESSNNSNKLAAKRPIGVSFLALSSLLVLTSRSLSIALFSVSETFWIFVPLSLHYIFHFVIGNCKPSDKDQRLKDRIFYTIYESFVNIFDMVGKGYSGVKCSYVFFYTVMLIENLTFSFYWMLTANLAEQFKLFLVLVMLLCFIVGLIIKFASCGCIFEVESDILSDAFNNPELGGGKSQIKYLEPVKPIPQVINQISNNDRQNEIEELNRDLVDATVVSLDDITDSETDRPGLSPRSRRGHRPNGEYINAAFVQSQGNISVNSRITNESNRQSGSSGNRHSKSSHGASGGSKKGKAKSRTPTTNVRHIHVNPGAELSDSFQIELMNTTQETPSIPSVPAQRHLEKPTIIVSDTSKHASLQRNKQSGHNITQASNGNLTLASSHYSRNTHTLHGTLNGSVKNYGYNGFDDPFREAFGKGGKRSHHNRRGNPHKKNYPRYPGDMDCSLDSSELYPSITSDSSSVSTYTDTYDRDRRHRTRHRMDHRRRRPRSQDGYSSDISNSDYLSFNDYSIDSSSWTESSESSSDGAATWPPSHTANLLKSFNVSDKESSTDNILHWLNNMDADITHDGSFSTLHEPSIASDTDISLSAMQTFEVKKEKRKFKKLISKPKGLFMKFSSLNYKGKEGEIHNRQFPLKKNAHVVPDDRNEVLKPGLMTELGCRTEIAGSGVPLPGDIVQESIV